MVDPKEKGAKWHCKAASAAGIAKTPALSRLSLLGRLKFSRLWLSSSFFQSVTFKQSNWKKIFLSFRPIFVTFGFFSNTMETQTKAAILEAGHLELSYETLRRIIRVFLTSIQYYNTLKTTCIVPRRVSLDRLLGPILYNFTDP